MECFQFGRASRDRVSYFGLRVFVPSRVYVSQSKQKDALDFFLLLKLYLLVFIVFRT